MFEPPFPVKEAEVKYLRRELSLLALTEEDGARREIIDLAIRFLDWFLKANTMPPGSSKQ